MESQEMRQPLSASAGLDQELKGFGSGFRGSLVASRL